MNFLTQKITDVKKLLQNKNLYDPRLLGLALIAFIGLSVLWNGAQVVQQNYSLQQKIAVIEEENRIIELKNQNKEIQIQYYKTPEFAELKARRVNGKAAPGEKVYVVTESAAVSALKTPEITEAAAKDPDTTPQYQKNFEAWIEFFFGRNN